MNSTVNAMTEKYNQDKISLDFFDVNCWWDPAHFSAFQRYGSFEEYYASFKKRGIKKAVLTTAESLVYGEASGNETMLSLISGHDDLYGAMVLTPDLMINGVDVGAYIGRMVEQKAVIARVFPRTNRHSIKTWVMGDIFKVLSERRIPLMIWHAETSWDTIDALCAEYPDLPVIVEGNDVKLLYHNRHYIPLFKKHKNLYLETHNVILHNEVDYFAKLDAERLLFGTYHLYNTPDAAMSQIVMGDFGADQKQLIAHGNLERLISGIR